jgi:homoserine kinase type II
MSVFTPIAREALSEFLKQYDVGGLVGYLGIAEGITNTNYYVDTEGTDTKGGRYVLTLYEGVAPEQPPYLLSLTAHLSEQGVLCARPIAGRDGAYLRELADKPAALIQRIPGDAPTDVPTLGQCQAAGDALAHLHLAGADFEPKRDNDHGSRWWRDVADTLTDKLTPEQHDLLREELRLQSLYRMPDAPHGAIHGDLFRDNTLFVGERLTGIIDFDFACHDVLLFDLAVAVNDWCSQPDQSLDPDRTLAFLEAYHARRPLTPIEHGGWPVMLRAAALRWWLSRLRDFHSPRQGELTFTKDPGVFEAMLRLRVEDEAELQRLWPG